MNNYIWYCIFNLQTFEETGLYSRTITLNLDGLGLKDILITKANLTSITYEGVMLPIEMNNHNPFEFDGYAVYIDDVDDVWLGILDED